MSKDISTKIIGFYRQTECPYGCFSQWYFNDKQFKNYEDIYFNSSEQFMMSEKAKLFNDMKTYDKIMKSIDQKKIKAYGKKVKNFDDNIWLNNNYRILLEGNLLKFSQNPKLKKLLLETNNKIIVEASPYDKIYGIGMSKNNKDFLNIDKWGKNLLGQVLMEIRNLLK